ncbi:helix-turn-helix domain-containing protein [Pleionea sediminis]|uniref:helix-turn-helix domain-containing protein n=1 Tax=Pleionea sediminis TaxID=2569479 RepID=UPI0011868711|nr:AraC family transcriptional regulator [Pleionea sediminis]
MNGHEVSSILQLLTQFSSKTQDIEDDSTSSPEIIIYRKSTKATQDVRTFPSDMVCYQTKNYYICIRISTETNSSLHFKNKKSEAPDDPEGYIELLTLNLPAQSISSDIKINQNKELSTLENKTQCPISFDTFPRKIEQLIDTHLQNITVHQLAARLYMDRSRLYRKVNEIYNESPQKLILRKRLIAAAKLLTSEPTFTDSIGEIAYRCGFNNLSYFARAFKEKYGQTPSEYRNNLYY